MHGWRADPHHTPALLQMPTHVSETLRVKVAQAPLRRSRQCRKLEGPTNPEWWKRLSPLVFFVGYVMWRSWMPDGIILNEAPRGRQVRIVSRIQFLSILGACGPPTLRHLELGPFRIRQDLPHEGSRGAQERLIDPQADGFRRNLVECKSGAQHMT